MKCPCHSQKKYLNCCKPFHLGEKLPSTPLELMKSRYSAYALKLPKYIIYTTSPDNPSFTKDTQLWEQDILIFCNTTTFVNLIIESTSMSNTRGTVSFQAHLFQNGQNVSFREVSLFEKIDGKWLYKSGEITPLNLV